MSPEPGEPEATSDSKNLASPPAPVAETPKVLTAEAPSPPRTGKLRRSTSQRKAASKPLSARAKKTPLIPETAESEPTSSEAANPGALPVDPEALPSEDETRLMAARSSSARLGPLKRCGRYELTERVARGGMGVVYRARHPEFERDFAIKVLSEGSAAVPEAAERFRREAKAAARLSHPGIVRVYDYGTEDGFPYLVMDFVEGQGLEGLIRDDALSPERSAEIAWAIAEALHHAHKQELVHRDVKPSNILITSEGEVRITDFGIVKELGGDEKLTRTGFTLGSPCYMSPEQAMGQHDLVGPGSDVYSLGATLYEMLTGEPPFSGESIHAIMRKVVDDDPAPPRAKAPAIPLDLESICLKAMHKEIASRYQSAREMALDLQAFLAGDPILARPPAIWTQLRRRIRRNRLTVALASLLVLTVLGSLGIMISMRLSQRSQRLARATEIGTEANDLLSSAPANLDWVEERRRLFHSINLYKEALLLAPDRDDLREARERAVVRLGDRLMERGQFDFAEFVYGLSESLTQDEKLREKVDVASKARWLDKAQEQVQSNDLKGAIAILEAGQNKLEQMGYDTEIFQSRINEYKARLNLELRSAEREQKLAAAQKKLKSEDFIGAFEDFSQAQRLGDPQGLIQAELDRLSVNLESIQDQAESLAQRQRQRLVAAMPTGELAEASGKEVKTLLDSADQSFDAAREARSRKDYRAASLATLKSVEGYAQGLLLALSSSARLACEAARKRANEANATRYAQTEMTKAKAAEDEAQRHFQARSFKEAQASFEQARALYITADAVARSQGVIVTEKDRAEDLEQQLTKALPPKVKTKDQKRADTLLEQARTAHNEGQQQLAIGAYQQAARIYADILALAPMIAKAYTRKGEAEEQQARSEACWAPEYADYYYDKALEALREGLAELGLENFEKAEGKFASAIFRFERAIEKTEPTATNRRKADAAKDRCEKARQRAVELNRKDTESYVQGEREMARAASDASRGYWPGAERRYDRATKLFLEAAGLRR